jgi:carotenoid cleavage dioxygenase
MAQLMPIDIPIGVMMHDFAITEHYTIFLNLPLTFRLERLAEGKPGFQFESKTPSYFGILPRHGQPEEIRWFEADPCYIFHTMNAYEAGDEIVLLACRMVASNVFGPADDPEAAARGDVPILTRWRFNLKDNSVREEALDSIPSEFPRINENYLGRKNRYGYTAQAKASPIPLFEGAMKYDLTTGQSWHYHWGSDRYGGEMVFVPDPNGQKEDDGWLMTFVYDQGQNTSELVILSAADLESRPVARVLIPQRIPYGFHGLWID